MKRIFAVILSLLCIVFTCGCEEIYDLYSMIETEITNLIPINEEFSEVEYEYYYIEQPEFNSCYNKLNSKQKNIYSRIRSISQEMTEGFVSLGYDYDDAMKDISVAYSAFLHDNVDVFWMPKTYILGSTGSGSDRKISIAFQYSKGKNQNSYNIKKSQRDALKAKLETVVNEIVAQTESIESEYEKEKYIHDYICDTVTYTQEGELINTAYGALVLKSALCEGYAKAFKLLCNKVGIACDLVSGLSQDEGHMWNIVNIDLKHSYVDVTWDDQTDYKTYAYFNITENQLLQTHTFSPVYTDMSDEEITDGNSFNFTLKDCSFTGNTYYEMNQYILWYNYPENAAEKIENAAQKGEKHIEFLFYSQEIQQEFEVDPNKFIAKIQSRLKNINIHSYVQERDVVILFYE